MRQRSTLRLGRTDGWLVHSISGDFSDSEAIFWQPRFGDEAGEKNPYYLYYRVPPAADGVIVMHRASTCRGLAVRTRLDGFALLST